MTDQPLLRIALPNKGVLSDPATEMLRQAGYKQRYDSKQLVQYDNANQVEFYYLRPRDIATYVGEGILDIGITGRDMLLDSGADAQEVMTLGFGRSFFRFATTATEASRITSLDGHTIATSYPGLLQRYLDEKGMTARLIKLDGAVESAVQLGVADVIADVVETGSTLRKAGLEIFGEVLLESEAILIKAPRRHLDENAYEHLIARLSGVIVARDYLLVDYDIAEDNLEEAVKLTPGFAGATISPIDREGWVAVRSLVPAHGIQQLMDELWDLGARGILTTSLTACRL